MVKHKFHKLENFTPQEVHLFYQAMRLQEDILNSEQFKSAFRSLKFSQNKGLSNGRIYEMIMTGISNYDHKKDWDIDYYVRVYDSKKKGTLAWTSMSTARIHINRLSMKNWIATKHGAAYCSSSMFHEYIHTMGFKHHIWRKRQSVPYQCGYLMRSLGLRVLSGELKLTPLKGVENGEEIHTE